MKVNSQLPVDAASVIPKFAGDGLALDLLSKCNSQHFKYIGPAGEGYFLFTSDQLGAVPATVTLEVKDTLTGTPFTAKLLVLDAQKLHHPDQTSTFVLVLHTAEEKYQLQQHTVAYNYNMVIRESIGTGTIRFYPPEDVTQMTLQEVMEDILLVVPTATLNYQGIDIVPHDVLLEGYSVFDALDILCRSFAMFWTMVNDTVYVFKGSSVSSPVPPQLSDVRKSMLAERLNDLSVVFPVASNGRQNRTHVAVSPKHEPGNPGEALTPFCPYYLAMIDTLGNFVNETDVNNLADELLPYYEGILFLLDSYWVTDFYWPEAIPPGFINTYGFVVTFADYGSGARTIISSRLYPYMEIAPYVFDEPTDEITYIIESIRTADAGNPDEAPYTGLIIATVTVQGTTSSITDLIGKQVDVVDHSGCLFNISEDALSGLFGWATKRIYLSLDPGADEGQLTPLHWDADDTCCPPA